MNNESVIILDSSNRGEIRALETGFNFVSRLKVGDDVQANKLKLNFELMFLNKGFQMELIPLSNVTINFDINTKTLPQKTFRINPPDITQISKSIFCQAKIKCTCILVHQILDEIKEIQREIKLIKIFIYYNSTDKFEQRLCLNISNKFLYHTLLYKIL